MALNELASGQATAEDQARLCQRAHRRAAVDQEMREVRPAVQRAGPEPGRAVGMPSRRTACPVMSAGYGMVGEALPPTRRVRRWCEDCQEFTWSVMVEGSEVCEVHPCGFDDDDDEQPCAHGE